VLLLQEFDFEKQVYAAQLLSTVHVLLGTTLARKRTSSEEQLRSDSLVDLLSELHRLHLAVFRLSSRAEAITSALIVSQCQAASPIP